MNPRQNPIPIILTATLLIAVWGAGCERDIGGLQPVQLSTDPVVFDDTFGDGVDYQAFLNSKLDAVQLDAADRVAGTASLRITVPGPNDPSGWFAGGAFTAGLPRNLSGYNAITFWAKASMDATLDVAGLGNDNTGTSLYEAAWSSIPLTTSWAKYVIPIPLPARLSSERGLFYFAEGFENNMGYDFWFDEIKFESVASITDPRPVLVTETVGSFVGSRVPVTTLTTFAVSGNDQTIEHSPNYFTFTSSADSVVTVTNNQLRVVGSGTAMLTARLGDVDATGQVTVNAIGVPDDPAPIPTEPPADVLSLFSNAYNDIDVYSWLSFPTGPTVTDVQIDGNDAKAYNNLSFAGIAFKPPPPSPPPSEPTPQIDATQLTHFHMDVWIPDLALFRVKLVDFGADGRFGGFGADMDSEYELTFTSTSNPPLKPGEWVSLDIPLDDFVGLQSREHLAQLIISVSSVSRIVFIDNVYFHK